MKSFDKVIYISHPYGGKQENLEDIERIVKSLAVKYPNYLFLSPCNAFGFLYDTVSYELGLDYCLWLLAQCDECWVFGDDYYTSTGVITEIKFCEDNNIRYHIWGKYNES